MKYRLYDKTGGGVTHDIEESSLEEAIERGREWIEDGDWGGHSDNEAFQIGVTLKCELREITFDFDGNDITDEQEAYDCSGSYSDSEPECGVGGGDDDGEHDWKSPYECVGGICENPGVWSLGGTKMMFRTCCAKCGIYRETIDNGCQRNPGEPVATVTYQVADDKSKKVDK